MMVAVHNSYSTANFIIKKGIGALPNFVRPFHHYTLRITHYALYPRITSEMKKPQLPRFPFRHGPAAVTTSVSSKEILIPSAFPLRHWNPPGRRRNVMTPSQKNCLPESFGQFLVTLWYSLVDFLLFIVRSEELGVRSEGRGAQLIKRPNTPFYILENTLLRFTWNMHLFLYIKTRGAL